MTLGGGRGTGETAGHPTTRIEGTPPESGDQPASTALIQRDAMPLLLVRDVMRRDVPIVRSADDLSTVLDAFTRLEVDHLPVCLPKSPGKVIGLISRSALMRRYQEGLRDG